MGGPPDWASVPAVCSIDRLPLRGDTLTSLYLTTCSVLVLVALMYAVSGWIMEKKLSV